MLAPPPRLEHRGADVDPSLRIPLAPLIAATRAAGFEGAYVVGIFSMDVADSLYDRDLRAVIRRSRDGLAATWDVASGRIGH